MNDKKAKVGKIGCNCGYYRHRPAPDQQANRPMNGQSRMNVAYSDTAAQTKEDQTKEENKKEHRITGTWDFKWTPGTTIRIAVQDLPVGEQHTDIIKARQALEAALESWVPAKGEGPNIRWEILKENMPAPNATGLARSDVTVLKKQAPVEYDVLVSFAQLPVTIEATSEHDSHVVNYPRCELGNYARRVEYGIPSLYLGPHQGFLGTDEKKPLEGAAAAKAWWGSPEGRFTLVHELGHLLGLAHEQQNPTLQGELDWLSLEEMVKIARRRNRPTPPDGADEEAGEKAVIEALQAFINSEVMGHWVGGKRYSDWRDLSQKDPKTVDFDSVMAKPVYKCFLKGNHGGQHDCHADHVCKVEQAEFDKLKEPTKSDRAHLKTMYGERSPEAIPLDMGAQVSRSAGGALTSEAR